MKKMLIFSLVMCWSLAVFAQDKGWIWGKVLDVDSRNNKIVLEYVDVNQEDLPKKKEDFYIDKDAQFVDVSRLEDLKVGDYVSLDFVKDSGKKKVVKLDRDNPQEILSKAQLNK